MAMLIEYYEVKKMSGYKYYYKPLDEHAEHKQNLDNQCTRIWKLNTRNNRFTEILNRENKPPVSRAEALKIQLMSDQVPWDEDYLFLQKAREARERLEADKSSTKD